MDNGASYYRRFLDGDESAFEELVKLYYDRLIFFINRFTHNPDDAEDLAVDTLLELLIHKQRYNFRVSLTTYLFTIAHHKAVNYLRRQNRMKMVPIDDMTKYSDADGQPSIEEKVILDERKRALTCELEKLPIDMREAVHLVYFEELSYEEAARVMRKNRKQIDNLLTRAKSILRTSLERKVQ